MKKVFVIISSLVILSALILVLVQTSQKAFAISASSLIPIPKKAIELEKPSQGILSISIEKAGKAEKERPSKKWCKDLCGDGVCQEFTCMAIGCPCPETPASCPQDCGGFEKCTPEGGKNYFGKPPCCQGLTPISTAEPKVKGCVPPCLTPCIAPGDGSSYCTKCGDGICRPPENSCNCPKDCNKNKEKIANPSALYCLNLGYKYENGLCIFPDGSKCDGWNFYRGKCGQKFTFCEKQGFKIENKVENMGTWTAEYAVCVFPDGSECKEIDFFEGRCGSKYTNKEAPKKEFCDALHPCPKGKECYKFEDQERPICWSGDPCQRCKGECVVLESYPAQVKCKRGIRPIRTPPIEVSPIITFPKDSKIKIIPKEKRPISIDERPVEFKGLEKSPTIFVEAKPEAGTSISVQINIDQEKKLTDIKVDKTTAITKETIKFEQSNLKVETPRGDVNLKILPNTATKLIVSHAPQEIKKVELKISENKPIYEVTGKRKAKLLWLIPVEFSLKTKVSAETGKIVEIKKPWWSFLAH